MPKLTMIRKQALDEMMKEAIFKTTVAVLSERGVDGLTMERVASEVGMAKGSLYRYFSSKQELIEFVFTKTIDPIFQEIEEIVTTEQPAIEKLTGQLRMLLAHVAKHAQLHRLLFENDAMRGILHSSERRTSEAATQQMAEIFRQGIAESVFRPGDPLLLARMYLGLCRGVLQSQPELDGHEQREGMVRVIMNVFLNGISTEKRRVG